MTEDTRIRLYMGTTGSGKTYLLHQHLKGEKQVFVFDLMADRKFENYGVLVDTCKDAVVLARRCYEEKKPFHIRMQTADVDHFNFFCRLLVKQPFGLDAFRNTLIVVDELAMFCSSNWMPEHLSNLVRLGRHTMGGLWATTQRPPDINPFIRSQAKEVYLFQMHEQADLDVFRKRIENVDRLIKQKQGEYILWNPQNTK